MRRKSGLLINRRSALKLVGSAAAVGTLVRAFPSPAIAQAAPLKVGFMLPYTGTYAALAKNIDNAFSKAHSAVFIKNSRGDSDIGRVNVVLGLGPRFTTGTDYQGYGWLVEMKE